MKILFDKHSELMKNIVNSSFISGIFQDGLKVAKVILILKKGDKQILSNCRPISLLNVISMIMDKLLKSQVMAFLERSGFLSSNQYGFRKGRNTTQAVMKSKKTVYLGFNNNKKLMAIFLDLTKAFSAMQHVILIKKMYLAGFKGEILNLFTSYLEMTKQYVKIEKR